MSRNSPTAGADPKRVLTISDFAAAVWVPRTHPSEHADGAAPLQVPPVFGNVPPFPGEAEWRGQIQPGTSEFTLSGWIEQAWPALDADGGLTQPENRLRDGFRQDIVHAVIVGPAGHMSADGGFHQDLGTPAQQAVVDGLLKARLAALPGVRAGRHPGRAARHGHSRRRPVRRAAGRYPARLAGRQPRRAKGRPHHPGADRVSARLAWLHLRSRRAPAAATGLLTCGVALWASLHYHWWLGTGNAADELPMIL